MTKTLGDTKQKLVLIAGLGHSGSTLLDLLMGGHGAYVGLGEIKAVIDASDDELEAMHDLPCSCGMKIIDCQFWGDVLHQIDDLRCVDKRARLSVVLDQFAHEYQGKATLVDSSKYFPYLKWLSGISEIDLCVIHIIRDVRSYTVSQLDNWKRKRGAPPPLMRFRLFLEWHKNNSRILNHLQEKKIPCFRVGYEELALFPAFTLEKICSFLGTDYRPSMLELGASGSHSILGNRMRHQPEKSTVLYDHRWLSRNDWFTPAIVFPHVMRFNKQNVYSNRTDEMWSR